MVTSPMGCVAQTAIDPLNSDESKFILLESVKIVWFFAANVSWKDPFVLPFAFSTFTVTVVALLLGFAIANPTS